MRLIHLTVTWYKITFCWGPRKERSNLKRSFLAFLVGVIPKTVSFSDAQTTLLWSTIQRLQSVPSGLAWKPSSSLLIIHLCLFTVTWFYATQPTQAPSAKRNVHQVAEEDVKPVITWLTCTIWPRAHSTWHSRNERKSTAKDWIQVVSRQSYKKRQGWKWVLFLFSNQTFFLFSLFCLCYPSRFQSYLPDGSVCDVCCLPGGNSADDLQKITWQACWVCCACQRWWGVKTCS